MTKSSGIIVYKIDRKGRLVFFVAHPGGMRRNYWAFLKGGIEWKEQEIDTALREFHEESGVSLNDYKEDLEYLGEVQQNPHKIVSAFGLNITGKMDINPRTCYSNLCAAGWPENDKYAWMTWQELEPITNRTHKGFYEKIIHKVNNDEH